MNQKHEAATDGVADTLYDSRLSDWQHKQQAPVRLQATEWFASKPHNSNSAACLPSDSRLSDA